MATRTMIFLVLFVVKPWLIFCKGTWKLTENIKADALLVVKLLPTLKHVINVNSQKKFHRVMNVPESDAWFFILGFFSFFFSRHRTADNMR